MKRFCVIGQKVSSKYERTWTETQEEATEHAKGLAQRIYIENRGSPAVLYVVEVKAVIECGMPTVNVREPEASDSTPGTLSAEGEESEDPDPDDNSFAAKRKRARPGYK